MYIFRQINGFLQIVFGGKITIKLLCTNRKLISQPNYFIEDI